MSIFGSFNSNCHNAKVSFVIFIRLMELSIVGAAEKLPRGNFFSRYDWPGDYIADLLNATEVAKLFPLVQDSSR